MRQIVFFTNSQRLENNLLVHRTIQVLIWDRMNPRGEDSLTRLSENSIYFNVDALGSQNFGFMFDIEPVDIKLLCF